MLNFRFTRASGLSLLATWALVAVCGTDAHAAPELTMLGTGPVEVKVEPGKSTTTAYVSVLNVGGEPAHVHVSFQASSLEGAGAKVAQRATIEQGKAARIAVALTGLGALTDTASGQIVVEGGSRPVVQAVTLTREPPPPLIDWPTWIVAVSLGVAALLMLVVVGGVWRKQASLLTGPAPGPKWNFDSWAAHLTGVGAILGTVLGAATLPSSSTQIDQESLVALSLLFAGLTAASPFVFQALRWPRMKKTDDEDANWGFTWGLLLACWLTLGGVLGELATLGLASWVIVGGGVGGVLLEVALGSLVLLAAYYVVVTAYALASTDWAAIRHKIDTDEEAAGDRVKAREKLREDASRRVARHVDFGPDAGAPRLSLRLP